MALPIIVDSGAKPPLSGKCGPHTYAGAVYVVARFQVTGVDHLRVWKADVPSNGFEAMDTANEPVRANATAVYHAIGSFVEGTDLYVVTQDNEATRVCNLHIFDLLTDTWSSTDLTGDDVSDSSVPGMSIGVRSDGDVVAFYQGETDVNMATNYERAHIAHWNSGAGWVVGISVSGIGKIAENEVLGSLVRGDATNDRMHCTYFNDVQGKEYSTYLSNNTFGHQATTVDADTGGGAGCVGEGASFDNATNVKVRIPYANGNDLTRTIRFNDADSPGTPSTAEIGDNAVKTFSGYLLLHCLAADPVSLIQFVPYIIAADDDLWEDLSGIDDDTFGTDFEVLQLGTATGYLASSCYVRRGWSRIGLLYDDNGDYSFTEARLTSLGSPGLAHPSSMVRLLPLLAR